VSSLSHAWSSARVRRNSLFSPFFGFGGDGPQSPAQAKLSTGSALSYSPSSSIWGVRKLRLAIWLFIGDTQARACAHSALYRTSSWPFHALTDLKHAGSRVWQQQTCFSLLLMINNTAVHSLDLESSLLHSFLVVSSLIDSLFAEAEGWLCQASAVLSGERLCVSLLFHLLWFFYTKCKFKAHLLRWAPREKVFSFSLERKSRSSN
jgi:hypothetical protein